MSVLIDGQLEVDSERGVIYFHAAGETILRINRPPVPIPSNTLLDITPLGQSVVSWNGCRLFHQEGTVAIIDLADDLQARKQWLLKIVKHLDIIVDKEHRDGHGGQLVATVSRPDAERIRTYITDFRTK